MIRSTRECKDPKEGYAGYEAFLNPSAKFKTTPVILQTLLPLLKRQYSLCSHSLDLDVERTGMKVTVLYKQAKEVEAEDNDGLRGKTSDNGINYMISKRENEDGDKYYVVLNEETDEYLTEDLEWSENFEPETCTVSSRHYAYKRRDAHIAKSAEKEK